MSVARPQRVRAGELPAILASARALAGRVPAGGWTCALVGLLVALGWSLLTPPFQVPDEPSHYSYVAHVAETGRPPIDRPPDGGNPVSQWPSPAEEVALEAAKASATTRQPQNVGLWLPAERRDAMRALASGASPEGPGYAFGTSAQPPLYYALEAIPYRLAGGSVLDRLAAMRALSALLGGLTVLLVFLFLRELLPRAPWAWSAGALGVALQPVFGFIAGGVNSDVLLFAAAAALFLCLARAFGRGLTPGVGLATGGAIAVGLLAKQGFLGLLPGAALALVLLVAREPSPRRRAALRAAGVALAVPVAAVLLAVALDVAAWDRTPFALVSDGLAQSEGSSLGELLSYGWQLYLPPLPGMAEAFSPGREGVWWRGFVGHFGWLDTHFPAWVETLALLPAALVALLAAGALAARRRTLWRRRDELAVYVALSAGVLVLTTAQIHAIDLRLEERLGPGQIRYFFPLLALYGAVLALAARAGGRRWGPAVGVLIVVLALAHTVFAQLLVVGRFYA